MCVVYETRGFTVSPIPTDLRTLKKPIYDRLAPASAGLPGNDVADIELIREEWLRQKVQDDLFARSAKAELKCVAACPHPREVVEGRGWCG